MARKKVIYSKHMQPAWRWNDEDLSGRTVAVAELTRAVILCDIPALGENALAATQEFLGKIKTGVPLWDAVLYYYGLPQTEVEQLAKDGDEFGLAIKRIEAGLSLKQLERVAKVEDKLYTAARDESPQDRKLFLQANKPQVYDRPKEAKITIEAVKQVLAEETTDELKRIAGIGDTEAS